MMSGSGTTVSRDNSRMTVACLVLLCCVAHASATSAEAGIAELPKTAQPRPVLDLSSIAPVSNSLFDDNAVKPGFLIEMSIETTNESNSSVDDENDDYGIDADISEIANITENEQDFVPPPVKKQDANVLVSSVASFIDKFLDVNSSVSVDDPSLTKSSGSRMDAISKMPVPKVPTPVPDIADAKPKFRRRTSVPLSPGNVKRKNAMLSAFKVPFRRKTIVQEDAHKSVPSVRRLTRKAAMAK